MSILNQKLNAHFAACAAAVAAVTAAPQQAEAVIVHSGPVNINIPSTTAGVYVNVVTGVNGTSPAGVPGWDLNPWSSTTLNFFNPAAPAGGVYVIGPDPLVDNLAPGTLISAASTFGSGGSQTAGATAMVLNSSDNLVGFRFQNEANGNQTHYGWMRLSLSTTLVAQPRAIVEYAYEDVAGAGIMAGAVPAPGALALLGLAGLVGARRRRA